MLSDELVAELQAAYDQADNSADNLLNFAPRAIKVGANVERANWLKYSHYSHASFVSALLATRAMDDNAPDTKAVLCYTYLAWALSQLNHMFEPMPWPGLMVGVTPRIAAAAERVVRP